MTVRFLAGLLAGFFFLGTACAGELQDLAGKAENEAKAGKHVEAIGTMREAMLALWEKSPLQFRRAFPVSAKATGFGIFQRRASNVLQPDEPLVLYAEPVGYGWKKEGEIFHSEIAADFELRDPAGKVLGTQKDFGNFKLAGYDRNTEYYMNLTYNFTGIPAGKYVIVTIFRDQVSGKSGTFETPFEVK